jgi:CDP-4-dehydro-6-deoxyglucose reductase
MPVPETFDARLAEARPLSPSVRGLVFERVDGAPFVFEAGQWVSLVLPLPEGELRRAYSIASAPDGTARFELAVTHVSKGPGSSLLHTLAPGTTAATLRTVGPQGFFTRPLIEAGPSLFIATGTGIAPFRSMILAARAAKSPHPMTLLFGVRHEEDILYRDELHALAREPGIRVEITLSQPGPEWKGRRGYVQTHVKELWADLVAKGGGTPHAFACGLHKMVGSARELLRKEVGLERKQVHTERYD